MLRLENGICLGSSSMGEPPKPPSNLNIKFITHHLTPNQTASASGPWCKESIARGIQSADRRAGCRLGHRIAPGSFISSAENEGGAAVGNHRQTRAEHDDDAAEPNPLHQRIQINVDDGLARFRAGAGINDIEIVERLALDGDHGFRNLAREVETMLGIEHHFRFAVTKDFQGRAIRLAIAVRYLIEILAEDGVRTDRDIEIGR